MAQPDKKVRWPDGFSLSWTPSLPRGALTPAPGMAKLAQFDA
ncbi:hypothetical protein CI41S_56200 [Bradyrhizobium ivorense]|nr:hypothetical protein CI41S_56200 [Bradyrhizobium ivorense]